MNRHWIRDPLHGGYLLYGTGRDALVCTDGRRWVVKIRMRNHPWRTQSGSFHSRKTAMVAAEVMI